MTEMTGGRVKTTPVLAQVEQLQVDAAI